MRKRSIKNTRVNTEVQHELSNIIRGGLKDPRVAPWTSVVAAEGNLTAAIFYLKNRAPDKWNVKPKDDNIEPFKPYM